MTKTTPARVPDAAIRGNGSELSAMDQEKVKQIDVRPHANRHQRQDRADF
jgi:hypothetical protein